MKSAVAASMLLTAFFSLPLCATDYQPGWPKAMWSLHFTLADVDSDPEPELLVANFEMYAFNSDGSNSMNWSPSDYVLPGDRPLVGDIDGDGEVDIVYAGDVQGASSQWYHAVSAAGVQKPGWPILVDVHLTPLQPSRCLADLDGDGDDEFLVLGKVDQRQLNAFNDDGTPMPGWPIVVPVDVSPTQSLFWTSLSAGDVDFDGSPEIAIGLYMREGASLIPSPFVLLDSNGNAKDGWPSTPPFPLSWQQFLHPMIADLSGNLQCEIFGAGFNDFHSFRADGTAYLPPLAAPYASRPGACGDIDGDGDLEVVMPGERLKIFSSQGILLAQTDPTTHWLYEGITLGDVNGDGIQEICALSGRLGSSSEMWIHLFDQNLNELPTWPKPLPGNVISNHKMTALADLDGDNDIEVITSYGGFIHVWDEPNTTGGPISTEWPMWGHNPKRNNFYHEGNIPIRRHLPGDVNGDEVLDLSDPIELLTHLFVAAQIEPCLAAFDFNDTGSVDLADPITILSYLFAGALPPAGVPQCGSSNTSPLPCARTGCP